MTNKSARQLLEMIYGKECMFNKANIIEKLKHLNINIKGYKVFVEETKYKFKKIKKLETTITYHHLEHEADGGETNIKNGALISEMAHRYIHSLPRYQEEIINNMLREYKVEYELRCGILLPKDDSLELQFMQVKENNLDDNSGCIVIPTYAGR